MAAIITAVTDNSPAMKFGLAIGDEIIAINGIKCYDVLDMHYIAAEEQLNIAVCTKGVSRNITVIKQPYEELGIVLNDSDELQPLRCKNKCKFCFVDQLPKGMRDTLYVKDDDYRLSFICGNYITLTNCGEQEIERIIRMRFSPLYISVHATDGAIKQMLIANPEGAKTYEKLQRLTAGGIDIHAQIVVCPDINDGAVLEKTLNDLHNLGEHMKTVASVPVGLTKHREGLYPLEMFKPEGAKAVVEIIERINASKGGNYAYASDEFYLQANLPLPIYEAYGDFEQIENGVGLVRTFEQEMDSALERAKGSTNKISVSLITGESFGWFLRQNLTKIATKFPNYAINVCEVVNNFFGRTITVSGLVTATDIIAQFAGKTADRVIIPSNMLREFSDTFLDGISVAELEKELNAKVYVSASGERLIEQLSAMARGKVINRWLMRKNKLNKEINRD